MIVIIYVVTLERAAVIYKLRLTWMTATPHRDVVAKMVFTDLASCCGSWTLWECWRENRVKAVNWNAIHTPTMHKR
jgi:hypothetical protein